MGGWTSVSANTNGLGKDMSNFKQLTTPPPLVNQRGANHESPLWIVIIEGITSSSMGDGKGTSAISVIFGGLRPEVSSGIGEISGDGGALMRSVQVIMRVFNGMPILFGNMITGERIQKVILRRVVSIKGLMVTIQEVTLETVHVTEMHQEGDLLTVFFNYVIITIAWTSYGPDGQKLGNVAETYDASKQTSAVKSG
ncbi:MAG: type VI secretion system tube protein Hcp [Holosporaceae bacterium]|jgi:hypothetical protein|nr:type VI secretion system tube protein Hcp [Holosporaceae bacterium]